MEKYVFVGCSSSNKLDEKYIESAKNLGIYLAREKYNLVFGAFNSGMMGAIYTTMKNEGTKVRGIAPEMYKQDFNNLQCDEEYLVDTPQDRAKLLIQKSDMIIFLAGGTGTLEEISIAIEMQRRKEIDKPIIIFDEHEFYKPYIQLLDNIDKEGFSDNCRKLFSYIDNYKDLDMYIKKHEKRSQKGEER